MYKEFQKNKSLLHQNWDLYNLGEPVLKLDTVSDGVVKKYYYKSYREFYLRPSFILKFFFSIRTFSEFFIYTVAALKMLISICRNRFSMLANHAPQT
jgi:anaerobic magnesium-protoporphyrin IX monomethyl ester cyclase